MFLTSDQLKLLLAIYDGTTRDFDGRNVVDDWNKLQALGLVGGYPVALKEGLTPAGYARVCAALGPVAMSMQAPKIGERYFRMVCDDGEFHVHWEEPTSGGGAIIAEDRAKAYALMARGGRRSAAASELSTNTPHPGCSRIPEWVAKQIVERLDELAVIETAPRVVGWK